METEEATLRLLVTMPVIKKRTKKEKVASSCPSLSLVIREVQSICYIYFIMLSKQCKVTFIRNIIYYQYRLF